VAARLGSRFLLATLVMLVAAAFSVSTASAGGSLLGLNNDCGSTSQPFAQFGDTPELCMGTTSTVMRYFVKGSSDGSVRVEVVLRGLFGQVLGVFQVSRISTGSSWQAGPPVLNLDSLLGLLGVSSVQLNFTTLSGTAQIDDLYVDPWASRN
jgi:hypothetical protein